MVSASSMDSAGWVIAHCTAAWRRSASAWSACLRRSRANAEHACRAVGQSGRLRVVPRGGHGSIPAATTDTRPGCPKMARIPLFHRGLQKLWCSILGLRPPATSVRGFVTGLAALLNQRWAGSRLVVTTRRRLSTLSAHHEVHELVLAPLDPGATCDLIHTGSSAPSACRPGDLRPGAWRGGWPLLLRHAAGKLALRPSQTMTAIVASSTGLGPGALLDDDPRPVDDSLATAYARPTPDAARLFERLGLVS